MAKETDVLASFVPCSEGHGPGASRGGPSELVKYTEVPTGPIEHSTQRQLRPAPPRGGASASGG
eukprot:9902300-Alexandrium_andersonii.AAC.1